MIDMHELDAEIFSTMEGLDTYAATFHRAAGGEPADCVIMINTLELADEFGVPKIQSGAEVHYLMGQVGKPRIGDWWQVVQTGTRYTIKDRVPSQDSNLRIAHCHVEAIE